MINRTTKDAGMKVKSPSGNEFVLSIELFKVVDFEEDKPNNKVKIHILNNNYEEVIWPYIDSRQYLTAGETLIEVSFYIDEYGRMICHGYEVPKKDKYSEEEQNYLRSLTTAKRLLDKPQEVDVVLAKNKLEIYIELIQSKELKKYIKHTLNKVKVKYLKWPAATSVHHNIVGGLLLHSINVARNAYYISKSYTDVDLDLVLTASLLHDIGKIFEYTYDAKVSELGEYADHITLGLNFLVESNKEQDNILDERTFNHLYHIILSHHGKLEWGSPRTPATKEAFIVHQADYIDTNMYIYHNSLKKLDIGEVDNNKYIGKVIQTKLSTSENYDIN